MSTLHVGLGERAYPIRIGRELLPRAGELLDVRAGSRAVIVTNAVVAAHHLQRLKASLSARGARTDVVLLPDGEAHKNAATLDDLLTRLLELRIERKSLLVAHLLSRLDRGNLTAVSLASGGLGPMDALWLIAEAETCAAAEAHSIGNLKRVWTSGGRDIDWFSPSAAGEVFLRRAVEVKNVWVPYGD